MRKSCPCRVSFRSSKTIVLRDAQSLTLLAQHDELMSHFNKWLCSGDIND